MCSRAQHLTTLDGSDRYTKLVQVSWRELMEALIDEETGLVVDTFSNGEPVQIISHCRSDVIKLSLTDYKPCSSIKHKLQPLQVYAGNASQDAVAVIQATRDGCMNKRFGSIKCQSASDCAQLP